MPGPPPKHGGRRPRKRPNLTVVGPLERPSAPAAPPPSKEWLVVTRTRWAGFWSSALAGQVAPETDLGSLSRLFDLYDEHERALRAFRKARLVTGSQGQPVLNPMGRLLKEMAAEIRQLEDRFGLSPIARLRLGAQYGSTAMTLEQLNRDLESDAAVHEDPRLQVIEGDAAAAE